MDWTSIVLGGLHTEEVSRPFWCGEGINEGEKWLL